MSASHSFTASQLAEMRSWCLEISWLDAEPEDIESASDIAIIRAVRRTYNGGLEQFLADSQPVLELENH